MMSSLNTMKPEEMVTCPYDPLHRIQRKKFQNHLIKCKANHPDSELLECKFNPTHLVTEEQYTIHMATCPDRAIISSFKNTQVVNKGEPVELTKPPKIQDEDEWDD